LSRIGYVSAYVGLLEVFVSRNSFVKVLKVAGALELVALLLGAANAQPPPATISVVAGTYGASCKQPLGNTTKYLAAACDGKQFCNFVVNLSYGDPAPGCAKDFAVEWRCGGVARTVRVAPEALGANVYLSCDEPQIVTPTSAQRASGRIAVVAGTYGASCKQPRGNRTNFLATACNNKQICQYGIDVGHLGDSNPGCRKDYQAEWVCGDVVHTASIGPEAAGATLSLSCDSAASLAASLAAAGKAEIYGVYFDTDQASVKPASTPTLDEVGKLLKANPSLKLEVSGHTDSDGGKDHNLTLSQARADAVRAVLLAKYGVAAARLTAKGYGDTKPVVPNNSDANKAKNRRVELRKL
jgi:hypothetical protein